MKNLHFTFYYIIGLFFFWGFVAASNDVLIPIFKDHLQMEQWQSQMISFVFYVAYTVGSILYLWISFYLKKDVLAYIGYNKGLSTGLFISFIGTLLFIPASDYSSFSALIAGLFIIGLGFSLQQTAANPLVIYAGDEKYGSQRLSLAGGINNIGTTIGPLLVSYAVFGHSSQNSLQTNLHDLKYPYIILGVLFFIIALFFFNLKSSVHTNENSSASDLKDIKKIVKQPQVFMGMLAIFVYVGVEVSTAANLAEFAKHKANINTQHIAPYVSLYWACLMIGRWASASDIFAEKKQIKILLKIIFPLAAFALFYFILYLNHTQIPHIEYMIFYIALLIALDLLSKGDASKQLMWYSLSGIILILSGMLTNGELSVFNIVAAGLFCSTLWPCIFEIALKGMKEQTGLVSSLLIMMIMGGGWISLLQGFLAKPFGIVASYGIGVLCFIYLFFYGLKSLQK